MYNLKKSRAESNIHWFRAIYFALTSQEQVLDQIWSACIQSIGEAAAPTIANSDCEWSSVVDFKM